MKKAFLLALPVFLLMTSCKFDVKEKDGDNEDDVIPDVETDCEEGDDVCIAEQVTGRAKANPAYPMYLKVGESMVIDAAETNPKEEAQKSFTFTNLSPDYIDFVDHPDQTKYPDRGTVTGKKACPSLGVSDFAKIKAVNDYTTALENYFNFRVIDFDPETMYLWQYDKTDRKQFYVKTGSIYVGDDSGTVQLGNREWSFDRGKAQSLNTNVGGISFGKNTQPEDVTLVSANTRPIKSIVLEHGSAKGLAQLSFSIGDEELKSLKSPYASNGRLTITKIDCKNKTGDLRIHFESPEYDAAEALDNPDYQIPGAVYLKSILIEYGAETVENIKVDENSKHQTVFAKWDDFKPADLAKTLIVDKNTATGSYPIDFTSLTITKPDFSVEPDAPKEVKISFAADGVTHETSYTIYKAASIEIDETNSTPEKLDYIEFSSFKEKGMVVWGFNEDKTHKSDITAKIKWAGESKYNKQKHTGTTALAAGETKVIGFIDGNTAVEPIEVTINPVYPVTRMEFNPDKNVATKVKYFDGDEFNSAGLEVLGYCEKSDIDPVKVTSNITWYDGGSYNPESTENSIILKDGTTKVVGVCSQATIEYTGISVVYEPIRLEKVTSASQLSNDGKYLIVSSNNNLVLDISRASSDGYKRSIEISEYLDNIEISKSFNASLFNVTVIEGETTKYNFSQVVGEKTKDLCVGSNGISTTKNNDNDNHKLAISFGANGIADITGTYTNGKGEQSLDKHLTVKTSNFTFSSAAEANLMIYKLIIE